MSKTSTVIIHHASPKYIIGDIFEMTFLGLRPGKKEKDVERIKKLATTFPEVIDMMISIDTHLSSYLENIGIKVSIPSAPLISYAHASKPEVPCEFEVLKSRKPKINIFPVDNVTLMKISKVLPLIYDPLIEHILFKKDVFNPKPNNTEEPLQYFTNIENILLETNYYKQNKTAEEQVVSYADSKIMLINNDTSNAEYCFNKLTEYIEMILKTPTEYWGFFIGRMVYEYRKVLYKQEMGRTKSQVIANFQPAPLILVHIIQMICSGIEYNVPYGKKYDKLQESVSKFMKTLKKLEIECYKYQTMSATNPSQA
jgi:hypothetical protein